MKVVDSSGWVEYFAERQAVVHVEYLVSSMVKSLPPFLFELAKWALVLWLMSPLAVAMHGPVDFTRVALGILLFILFTGKMLYDTILAPAKTRADRTPLQDVLAMFGSVAVIALAVGMMLVLVGLYVMKVIASWTPPQ